MTNQEIKLRCAEMSNKAASDTGLNFEGRTNEPFIIVAEKIFKYATEPGKDTELRLKCAEMALKTVNKRGFMGELLQTKIQKIEEYVTGVSTEAIGKEIVETTEPVTSTPQRTYRRKREIAS